MPGAQELAFGQQYSLPSQLNPQRMFSALSKETKSRKLQSWQQPLNHTFLYGLNYAYRAST